MSLALPLCGYGWGGFGCGRPIGHIDDLYRCADCRIPFHQACLKQHFGGGRRPHAFARETAWLVTELLQRETRLDELRRQIAGLSPTPELSLILSELAAGGRAFEC